MAAHKFHVGQMVELSAVRVLRPAATGAYTVQALFPERDGELQYRIKSEREPHERVVRESEIRGSDEARGLSAAE